MNQSGDIAFKPTQKRVSTVHFKHPSWRQKGIFLEQSQTLTGAHHVFLCTRLKLNRMDGRTDGWMDRLMD